MNQGIEPDQCFYIQNESKIRGKKRLDLQKDPPPDLALEIDVTLCCGAIILARSKEGRLR